MENAQPEPSMEEILASIRRIISEDEDEPTTPVKAAEGPTKPELTLKPSAIRPAPAAAQASVPAPASVPAQPPESSPVKEDVEMIRENLAAAMDDDHEEDILDHATAEVASNAFRNLTQSVRISEGPGRTLEELVVEMLRPMVKEWLDANLPGIVEEKVEEEVQRVARRRR